MSTAPTPIAEGTLAETPFAHALLSIERRALSGTLAVWPDDDTRGQDRILFESGRIVAARLLEAAACLELGLLPLFRRTRAPYAFYAEDLVGPAQGVLRGAVAMGALVAAGLRGDPRTEVATRILAGHGERPLRIVPGAAVASLALLPKEHAVVELLRAEPAPAERLVALSGDPETARRVLYLLTITKMVEPCEAAERPAPRPSSPSGRFTAVPDAPPSMPASEPSASAGAAAARAPEPPAGAAPGRPSAPPKALTPNAPAPPPPPPAELTAEARARWSEIAAFAVAMDDYNYFQVLGVGEAAGLEEITAAYAERVKHFHPDRLGPELRPLAPVCQTIFHQLTEARKALSDTDARMAHVKAVRSGGGTPAHDRKLTAIVGAAMEFQKVDVLVRQRRFDEALALLEQVLAIEPNEPDYLARKAWVLFLVHPEKSGPFAQQILALADRALAKNERHEQAHFTKASMLKRQGQLEAAVEHFRLVAKANPKNIDAVREVRLAEMRKRGSAPAPGKAQDSGLLKKLFSKKP